MMFLYVLSIMIIVISNTLYNICSKSIPEKANPFSSLVITYLTGTIVALAAFKFYKSDKGFFQSFGDLNWSSIVLGFCVVGVELGYIMAYRAGWNISMGSLVANIILALMLIPIGILFFKEGFGQNQVLGIILCIVGLMFINKK